MKRTHTDKELLNAERRDFLKKASASAVVLMTTGLYGWEKQANQPGRAQQPLHPGLLLPGVHAYPGQESVEAGSTIHFFISSSEPFQVSICKLGKVVDDPGSDEVLYTYPRQQASQQAIFPGSYVYIPDGLEGNFNTFSAEGWVRPWTTGKIQAILSQGDFMVKLNTAGGLDVQLKDKVFSTPANLLKKDTWHHWAISCNGKENSIWIDGKAAGRWQTADIRSFRKQPLLLGASVNNKRELEHFLDADLAAVILYNIALPDTEVGKQYEAKGLVKRQTKSIIASWDFSEEKGDIIHDVSGNNRDGRIINHGTWMIGGPSFSGKVPRFEGYDPVKDATRGHGLRLTSDDLYDCGWKETIQYQVPPNAKPGFYVARITYEREGKNDIYDVSFVVKRAAMQKKAPILVMASTNTWRAYNATPFAIKPSTLTYNLSTEGIKNSPDNPPAYSFYRAHQAGQGTYQVGLRIPWPAAGPYVLYGPGYSHLLRGERFTHLWLEGSGYDFDLITDTDLHKNPGILKNYKVFLINGHSEYWSIPMYQAFEDFLKQNGKAIILSGNSLFWRVSFNEEVSVMECRKVDAPGDQVAADRRGEAWHSHDKLKGGLMRETDYPGWKLTGLEMLGWINSGLAEQYGPYVVSNPDHFLFNEPEKTGLQKGDTFGQAAGGKLPGANGHEIDIRLSTLQKLQEKPGLSHFPQEPTGITTLANGKIPWKVKGKENIYSGESFDFYMRKLTREHQQGAEMIYWERPDGGTVFNAGAIGAGWALSADPKLQVLLKNVLHHFGV